MFLKQLDKSYGQKLTSLFQKLTIVLIFFMAINLYSSEKITLGLTGVTLKEDIATIMSFKNYLSKHIKVDVNLKFAKSYSIMESFIINESVDFAYVCGATYVDLEDLNKIELFVIPQSNGKNTYSSLIIAQQDSKEQSLIDFQNKTFAMSDPDSNSGSLLPFYEIIKQGYNKDNFFNKVIYTYDHGESIEAVLNGFVHGASVDSMVYDAYIYKHPSAKNRLKIVQDFSNYPIPPFIIRKNLPLEIRQKLQTTLLNMHKDKKGKQILKAMSIDNFEKPNNISYEKIKKVKEYMHNYRNKNVQ